MFRTFFVALTLLAISTAHAFPATISSPTNEPLLYPANLQYIGSFRLPNGPTNQTTFSYGGIGLGFDPTKNALFVTGHTWYQYTGEVSIPTPLAATNVSALPVATLIQPLTDALDGERNLVNPTASTAEKIGGYLVYQGKLIISVESYYDGNGSQVASHFVRPLNLSAVNSIQGPYRIGPLYPGFVSGYMTLIPPEWQPLFGGPALTGNCCLPIISEQSNGPSISVFDPAKFGTSSPVPTTELLGYPISNPLSGYNSQFTQPINAHTSQTGDYFNGTTAINGAVFPAGTSTILFFGHQGLGAFCYGQGTTDNSVVGTDASGPSDVWCYDAATAAKGVHAYPYTYEIWAYNANDLLQVEQGKEAPYDVKPYAVWALNPPINPNNTDSIQGAAYDPTTNRIYLSQGCADANCQTIIDVYQVTGASTPAILVPAAPSNAKAQ